jgi:hypothetical protein
MRTVFQDGCGLNRNRRNSLVLINQQLVKSAGLLVASQPNAYRGKRAPA